MRIMVLNDGETYSDLYGCEIIELPDDIDGEDIEEALENGDGHTVKRFGNEDCQ